MALKPFNKLPVQVKRSRQNLYEYIRHELDGNYEVLYFDSFGDSACAQWIASGTVETTGVIEWDYTQVKVLTNSSQDTSWIGRKFFVVSDIKKDGSQAYQLYLDDGTTGTGVYVKIYKEAPERTVSISVTDGTDPVQGAKVVIEGTEKTTGSAGGCSFTLPDGKHSVAITKTGFEDKAAEITVAYDEVSFTIALTEESS